MKTRTFKNLPAEERDRYAWQAMNEWPLYSGINPVYRGLDFSELTRCFLMNKIARAIRRGHHPENFELETALERDHRNCMTSRRRHVSNAILQIFNEARLRASEPCRRLQLENWRGEQKRILYVPENPSESLRAILKVLKQSEKTAIAGPSFQIPWRVLYSAGLTGLLPEEKTFAAQLHQGILKGLLEFGIELLAEDQKRLEAQLLMQLYHLRVADLELERLRPAALLSHNPRTFPGIDYVFLAGQKGIPVFVIQSGLDGDAYVLDPIYGDYVLAYGKARAERYALHSKFRPREIKICGAPEMDGLKPAGGFKAAGKKWLWLLRAHVSDKCLLPSNNPREGIRVLRAFLDLLKADPEPELIIKPHPQGAYLNEFRRMIRGAGLEKRVRISRDKARTLFCEADLVFTEDCTPGMEAMFFAKALIHVHFSEAPSILPFAGYKAALAANSPASLGEAVQKVLSLSKAEQEVMASGQREFLSDFAGPCDGRAARRAVDFILSKLEKPI